MFILQNSNSQINKIHIYTKFYTKFISIQNSYLYKVFSFRNSFWIMAHSVNSVTLEASITGSVWQCLGLKFFSDVFVRFSWISWDGFIAKICNHICDWFRWKTLDVSFWMTPSPSDITFLGGRLWQGTQRFCAMSLGKIPPKEIWQFHQVLWILHAFAQHIFRAWTILALGQFKLLLQLLPMSWKRAGRVGLEALENPMLTSERC